MGSFPRCSSLGTDAMAEVSNKETVKSQIRDAFGRTRYPGDNWLPYDDEGFATALRGKTWQDVIDAEFLVPIRDCIFFLSCEAFRYYLPGFLIAILDYHSELDYFPDALVRKLAPQELKGRHGLANSSGFLSGYTPHQEKAILAFFRLYRTMVEPEFGLEDADRATQYWTAVVDGTFDWDEWDKRARRDGG